MRPYRIIVTPPERKTALSKVSIISAKMKCVVMKNVISTYLDLCLNGICMIVFPIWPKEDYLKTLLLLLL